jgi:hypothetical protein
MKRLFRIFELSKNEQRVVLIVMFALIVFAFVGYERRVHHFRGSTDVRRSEILSEPCRIQG